MEKFIPPAISHYYSVKEFHVKFNLSVRNDKLPHQSFLETPLNERQMRVNILMEEVREYLHAESENNLVDIADALADILYVAYGTCISYGIPILKILDEVHRSNMSKLGGDGEPIKREDGKILKGPNYVKPDVAGILSANLIKTD